MARKAKLRQGEFAVIGLGRFGSSLARRLEALGHVVVGVDSDMARVREVADEITSAIALDATDEDALQQIDITSFSTVIVGVGNFETSALIVTSLKRLGIPQVVCLAATGRHRDVLLRIGADQAIVSDEDSGERLAETLGAPHLVERAVLDEEHSLVQLRVPAHLAAITVAGLRGRGVSVLLIQRPGLLLPNPPDDAILEQGDTVFASGERETLLKAATPA